MPVIAVVSAGERPTEQFGVRFPERNRTQGARTDGPPQKDPVS
jgi:hypothetical protein